MRGATKNEFSCYAWEIISIHAPHAGRDANAETNESHDDISIHAPHAGRDGYNLYTTQVFEISIHAPHAGRDVN